LEGPSAEEEEKEEKKEEEENEPDQDGEPTDSKSVPSAPVLRPDQEPDTTRPRQPGRTSVTSSPKVPAWAWALGGVALLALVTYLAVTTTPTSTPKPSATPTATPFPTPEIIQVYDHFDGNDNGWGTGTLDSELWRGTRRIEEGKYVWNVKEAYGNFIAWNIPEEIVTPNNLYLSVDAKRVTGPRNTACYGLVYRDGENGYYAFEACDAQYYQVRLNYEDGWETLIGWTESSTIRPGEVNNLAVNAKGNHFEFFINGQFVNSMDDDTLASGDVGIAITADEGNIAVFEFDNFVLR
jgi:hypothetical protein